MFDDILISHLKQVITGRWKDISNKTTLLNALKDIDFYSEQSILHKGSIRKKLFYGGQHMNIQLIITLATLIVVVAMFLSGKFNFG